METETSPKNQITFMNFVIHENLLNFQEKKIAKDIGLEK